MQSDGTERNGTGVACQDCPYQDVWYPIRTEREKCKHDLVHEDHTVEYVDPSEVSKVVKMDGEVVTRLDEQDTLVTDGGTSTSGTERSPDWICTDCKKAITSRPAGPCHDCGGHFRPSTEEDLACDRCGDDDGRRLLDRTGEFDRLCPGCIDEVIR